VPFAAALSQHPEAAEATGEAVGHILEQMDATPDLAFMFCSPHHAEAIEDIADTVRALVSPGVLLGVTAGAVVGGNLEVEDGPALSLWTATLPSAPRPVRMTAVRTASGAAIQGLALGDLEPGDTLLLLADPFTLPVDAILEALDAGTEDVKVAGGLASGASGPGGNRLVLDGEVVSTGGVGVVLGSATGVRTVVSQGCRPVGEPMIVTQSDGNVIAELAGRPALDRVEELARKADPDERALLAGGLHVGLAIDEHRATFGRGDFLIRNVLGAEPASRSVVVGDAVPVGTTVQFQVRDAEAADEDLRALLTPAWGEGALLFTCNGRGSHLFGTPHHDATAVHDALGTEAIAGMSCAGEIGPVGSRSFLHSFTASAVLFGS
jgi:small ligand-binding sensory domain FIST